MPQYGFLQAMYVAALISVAAVALAMPAGARFGARTGALVKRGAFVWLLLAVAACLAWGASSGDLARFNQGLGFEAWLQMGAWFGIVLFTANHFVTRYLEDKAASEREAAAAAGSREERGEGGTHA